MKTKTKYVDEISGEEFGDKDKAVKSEKKSKDIKYMFSFWRGYKFNDDEKAIQRTKEDYDKLIVVLMDAIRKYEPWIYKQYKNSKGGDSFLPEYIKGYSMIGRYLDDSSSPLYHWWGVQLTVCPKCYRQYGQPYYAINCKCGK